MASSIIINIQYTVIHYDRPTGKLPGIWKDISAMLPLLTFPNLTRSIKILPISGDRPSRLKLQYRAQSKNAAHKFVFLNSSHVREKPEVWDRKSHPVTLHLIPTEKALPAGKHICARDCFS